MTDNVKHAFLSYVHEDADKVDRLQEALEEAGIAVWRDIQDLWPGDDWQQKIRDAIREGSLAFVVCMSMASVEKERSYQNEELHLAVAEYRLRPPGASWLIPVRLDDCSVPPFDLSPGKTLGSLHYVDFFGPREAAAAVRIVTTVNRILQPAASSAAIAGHLRAREAPEGAILTESVKALIRDPYGDIQLEELVDEVAETALDKLTDPTQFPELRADQSAGADLTIQVRDQMLSYENVMQPLTEIMILAGTYAKPEHSHIWTRALDLVMSPLNGSDAQGPKGLQKYPALWLIYATAIASVARSNFDPLFAVTERSQIKRPQGGTGPVAAFLNGPALFGESDWIPSAIVISEDENVPLDDNLVRALQLKQRGRRHTPVSDLLYKHLRPLFTRLIRDDDSYTAVFDKAEIILDLQATDIRRHREANNWLPAYPSFGCYTWRYNYSPTPFGGLIVDDDPLLESLAQAGLFASNPARAREAFNNLADEARSIAGRRW